jgi:hypothetical protein
LKVCVFGRNFRRCQYVCIASYLSTPGNKRSAKGRAKRRRTPTSHVKEGTLLRFLLAERDTSRCTLDDSLSKKKTILIFELRQWFSVANRGSVDKMIASRSISPARGRYMGTLDTVLLCYEHCTPSCITTLVLVRKTNGFCISLRII